MTFLLRHRTTLPSAIVTIAMLMVSLANAQQARGRGGQFPAAQRVSQILDRMGQALAEVSASDEQHKKIDPILTDGRQKFQTLVGELIPEQPIVRRQRLADFLTDLQGRITANLSPEQGQSYREKVGDFRQELVGNFVGRRGAASQPAMMEDAQPPRLGMVLERLRDYLSQVDLSDTQKNEVDTLFANSRKRIQEVQQSQADANAQRQQEQQIVAELRQELGAILTAPQLERLRLAIAQSPGGGTRGQGDMPMMPAQGGIPAAGPTPPATAAEPEISLLDVGQAAPDFSLKRVDGAVAQLSQMKGRLVLIVFGSYSSPSFRQRAASLDKLNRDYAGRVVTQVIYTRENHPVGDWNVDRNKDENISVEQPADMNGRIALARQARTTLKINLPFLMDAMDDATAKAYGGLTNAAYLIGRDGTVLARQKWFEPYAMRADIEEALKQSPPPKPGG